MTAEVGPGHLRMTEVRRFANRPVRLAGTLHWDVLGLYGNILDGLRTAGPPVASIGVDSWGVDYGLLDRSGALVGNPVHYRDGRTDGVMGSVLTEIGAATLYDISGVQFLPFNTIFQLVAAGRAPDRAETMLLIPDLIAYWLTGAIGAELTNASTTGLLDVRTRTWAYGLADRLGIPRHLLPPLREPGDVIGPLRPDVAEETGLPADVPVVAVGSHDTASAVAAVPAATGRFAYISCGTWSLVGTELPAPVLTTQGRTANFTNEAGIDGTVRYLRNVMGLWLLQESLRAWGSPPLPDLLRAAEDVPPFRSLVDPDAPEFLPPGDMPARIADWCADTGQPVPATRAEFVRCVLDSLALGHRAAVRTAAELSGLDLEAVHLVGGGAHNELLCRLTADACGLPVIAGPAEATAIGNILVQARTHGLVTDLPAMRALVARTQDLRRYEPTGNASGTEAAWANAAARIGLP
ncbi:MAG TPA: rhamnulokinase family protein [Streptosporangiaceae bacterium]|nr:rhamnulokinase family protein [Streptosporangiaceae bacterium]